MTLARSLIVVVLALGAGAASACVPGALAEHDASPIGRAAVAMLATTLRGLEPALPRTVIATRVPAAADDPLYEDLRYLRERELIPRDFAPERFDRSVWQSLLDTFLGWYGLGRQSAGPADSVPALRADLDRAVGRVLDAMRPVALLAWDPEDEDALAFVGVVWNWSPYPRLIVRRPPEGWSMRDGPAALAGSLDVCGRGIRDYIAAPAPVARDLFLANAAATMYLVGAEPHGAGAWPYQVPTGAEVDVFAFEHPEVRELDAFSAVFVGDRLSMLSMVGMLPAVRTNLSPMGLVRVMQTPPRR